MGTDSDYSFCPITFKLHMHIRHDERRDPIDFGLRSQRSRSTLALCTLNLLGTITTTVFVQSLSNFTCTFAMMRGGTLLIFGSRESKVKVDFGTLYIKPCGHDSELQFLPNHFQTSHAHCAMMRGGTLLILGHEVKGPGQLLASTVFAHITFKLHMHICHG